MMRRFRHGMYRLVSGTALLLGSFAIALIALEIGLRILDGIPILSPTNFVDSGVNAVINPGNPLAQFDDQLGWAQVPNHHWVHDGGLTNTFGEYGVRMSGSEILPLPQGAILVIGDSFAMGSEVNPPEAWPAQLEKMVGTQVINAAVGGYGFDQIVLRAEDLLPRLKPKMLLIETNVAFGVSLNRMSIYTGAPKPYFVPHDGTLLLRNRPVPRSASSRDIGWLRAVFGYSYLVQYIMTRLDLLQWWVSPAMTTKFALSKEDGLEVSCLLMRRLGALRDRYRIGVGLVFQYGGPDGIATTVPWQTDLTYVSRCAEKEHLPIVDVHEALHRFYRSEGVAAYQQLWMMHDAGRAYGHMSAKGNDLVARVVFQQLVSPDVSEAKAQSAAP